MTFGSQDVTSSHDVIPILRQRFRLTATQARVAVLLADRRTNAEIADALSVKPSTARRHTEAVLLRLNLHSRFMVVSRLAEVFDQRESA